MGYSFDSNSNTTVVYSTSISSVIGFSTGVHVLHIKSWGNQGASCVTDVNLTVVAPPTSAVPNYAEKATQIQTLGGWLGADDLATGAGLAKGLTNLVSLPSLTGNAREFQTSFTNSAGERYYATFGVNTEARNFLYDGWVYFANGSAGIENLELDLNQVTANGQTVIFGFQCDGYSGTWDYTVNAGTAQQPNDQWRHAASECNPHEWSTGAWHHIQISYSRDGSGNVTYKSVWLDNVESDLYVTVPSAFNLGWSPALLTNFQVDGQGTQGSSTVYLDQLTIYWW